MMTRIVTMTRAVTMTIVMVKILFSPCHAERTGAICEQPADPRDDRPQRAHRLHHRQGGIQSGRDQVEFSSFLDSQLVPFSNWKFISSPQNTLLLKSNTIYIVLPSPVCRLSNWGLTEISFDICPLRVMICLSNFCICISSQEFPYFKHALTHFNKFYTESSVKGRPLNLHHIHIMR